MAEFIHYNIYITRDKKNLFLKSWHSARITQIKQLVNEEGKFMDYKEFQINYPNLNTNFLLYRDVIGAIKNYQQKSDIILWF